MHLWSSVAVARWSMQRDATLVNEVNLVQFPVPVIYLGMWPATQVNSAWPSLHG